MYSIKGHIIIILTIWFCSISAFSQYYRGNYQEFGKNRVQYDEFNWTYYTFKKYDVYFYANGKTNAIYTAKVAADIISDLEKRFDYYLEEKVQFILYNKFDHYKQSNIGVTDNDQNDIGGITRTVDSKVFLYFDGDHNNLEKQLREGVTNILINRLMLGKNWKEVIRNSALLTIPDWYINGLISYIGDPWNAKIEDQIRDGVLSGRFRQFNKLSGEDATVLGHAIWKYVANIYGEKVISNILYMSRLSRNVESGFLYVIGLSLKSLSKESLTYYQEFFKLDELSAVFPEESLQLRMKGKKKCSQLKISPDGNYISYVTNELGKYKVWLYHIESGKTTKIFGGGYKLDWFNDLTYPLTEWHPKSSSLAIISERKAKNQITFYQIESGEKITKPILKLDRIVNFTYAPDGKHIIFSAIYGGQTDLYEYKISSNFQKRLTHDIYDDVDPAFFNGKLLFSSNRLDDTLRMDKHIEAVAETFDLFMYDYKNGSNVLKRVTNTPDYNERDAKMLDSAQFVFLSDENQVVNRYLANFDSVISHIDTIFHYRYVTDYSPMTSYSRNILEHHFAPEVEKYVELLYKDQKYVINYDKIDLENDVSGLTEPTIPFNGIDDKNISKDNLLEYILIDNSEVKKPVDFIDYNNYVFESEKTDLKGLKDREEVSEEPKKNIVQQGETTENLADTIAQTEKKKFKLSKQFDYKLAFSSLDLTSQLNFNYTTQLYQRYSGQLGYLNTRVGEETSISLVDLFNNYEVRGGIRYSLDFSNKEYFLSYNNRKNRLNKKYEVARHVNEFLVGFDKFKNIYNQASVNLKYPFNEVISLRGTGNMRYDKFVELSTEKSSLHTPTTGNVQSGLKLELVFDNTSSLGLNLLKGTRAKIFAETYNDIFDIRTSVNNDSSLITPVVGTDPDITVLGLDVRKYIKIQRELIWANRLAMSTSIGKNKLLYYMGGVDNKIHFTDKPRFNYNLPVSSSESFAYQTLATNIRGFLQNSRNGSSFALYSSEIRMRVFKYFAKKPLKSDFMKNFQTILFTDVGTAWTGKNPFSDDNYFNTTVIEDGNVKVILRNQDNPIIGSYGFGFRSRLLGYFLKWDIAWAVEDGKIRGPGSTLSVGVDF